MTKSVDRTTLEVFALRHAEPFHDGLSNPGIYPSEIDRVKLRGQIMTNILRHQGEFTVFSSPSNAAVETASILTSSGDLQHVRQKKPQIVPELAEYAPEVMEGANHDEAWIRTIKRLGTAATELTNNGHRVGLVLVTHEPVIRDIPYFRTKANTFYLGLNHHRTSLK